MRLWLALLLSVLPFEALAEDVCPSRQDGNCIPTLADENLRKAAAKAVYLQRAIVVSDPEPDRIVRIQAMVDRAQRGFPRRADDFTRVANDAADELRNLKSRAEGSYRIPYLNSALSSVGSAASSKVPGSLGIAAAGGASVAADITSDAVNFTFRRFDQIPSQNAYYDKTLSATQNSVDILRDAFAAAKMNGEFRHALEMEIAPYGVRPMEEPDVFRESLYKKQPQLIIPDLEKQIQIENEGARKFTSKAIEDFGHVVMDNFAAALAEEGAEQQRKEDKGKQKEADDADARLRKQNLLGVAEGSLAFTVAVIGVGDPATAARVQNVGGSALRIYDVVDRYGARSGSDLTSTLGTAAMTMNVAAIGIQLFASLASNPGPSADQLILEQLADLQKQLTEMRKAMETRFDQIDMRLSKMSILMAENFDQISAQFEQQAWNEKVILDNINEMAAALYEFKRRSRADLLLALKLSDAPTLECFERRHREPKLKGDAYRACLNALERGNERAISELATGSACQGYNPDVAIDMLDFGGRFGEAIPDYAKMEICPLVRGAEQAGIFAKTGPLPSPDEWLQNAEDYIRFSQVYEPIRRELGSNPATTTAAVLATGNSLNAFFEAIAPSEKTYKFHLYLIQQYRSALTDLLASLNDFRQAYETNDLRGWSFEELRWIARGSSGESKPAGKLYQAGAVAKPAVFSPGLVSVRHCKEPAAYGPLNIISNDLPVPKPLYLALEALRVENIDYCFDAAWSDIAASHGYNKPGDTTWIYKSGVLTIELHAVAQGQTITTRFWRSSNPLRFLATEYRTPSPPVKPHGGRFRDPVSSSRVDESLLHYPVLREQQQTTKPNWVIPVDWGCWETKMEMSCLDGLIGKHLHDGETNVDLELSRLKELLPNNTFSDRFQQTGEPTHADLQDARSRLSASLSEWDRSFKQAAFAEALTGARLQREGYLGEVEAVRAAALKVFVRKAALGGYLQLGLGALFEADGDAVALMFGDEAHRLLDPYSVSILAKKVEDRPIETFQAELEAISESRIEQLQTTLGRLDNIKSGKQISFAPLRFTNVMNQLRTLNELQMSPVKVRN